MITTSIDDQVTDEEYAAEMATLAAETTVFQIAIADICHNLFSRLIRMQTSELPQAITITLSAEEVLAVRFALKSTECRLDTVKRREAEREFEARDIPKLV